MRGCPCFWFAARSRRAPWQSGRPLSLWWTQSWWRLARAPCSSSQGYGGNAPQSPGHRLCWLQVEKVTVLFTLEISKTHFYSSSRPISSLITWHIFEVNRQIPTLTYKSLFSLQLDFMIFTTIIKNGHNEVIGPQKADTKDKERPGYVRRKPWETVPVQR